MVVFDTALRLKARVAAAAFKDEVTSERAVLDFTQDLLHGLAGFVSDDAATGAVIAELGGVADGLTHLAEDAFIDEVNDELHLVAAFKIGDFGLIAGSDQRFETGLDQFRHTAAQDGLFAEEVGFGFFLEGGFDHAGTRPADALGICLLYTSDAADEL